MMLSRVPWRHLGHRDTRLGTCLIGRLDLPLSSCSIARIGPHWASGMQLRSGTLPSSALSDPLSRYLVGSDPSELRFQKHVNLT